MTGSSQTFTSALGTDGGKLGTRPRLICQAQTGGEDWVLPGPLIGISHATWVSTVPAEGLREPCSGEPYTGGAQEREVLGEVLSF
jgi:hypothetical protein